MGLRAQATADLQAILEDENDFAWDISVTDPSGATASLKGFTADIGTDIDLETGATVAGRRASIALPIAALAAAGLGIPVHISDAASNPWVVSFLDGDGVTTRTFKVVSTMPDSIGVVTCLLEVYKPLSLLLTEGGDFLTTEDGMRLG